MFQKGIVLFTTMIMLTILAILILSLMQAVFLYVKASNQLVLRHQAFYQMEKVIEELSLANLSSVDSRCVVIDKHTNEVIELLKHHQGCEINHAYHYLIEDLGVEACLEIEKDQTLWSSHHWLLSVISQEPPFALLQVRVAEPVILEDCKQTLKLITGGVLTWRYFDSI